MAGMSYSATATLTMNAGMASLASGMMFVGTAVSNATNLHLDVFVWVRSRASASASVNAVLEIYGVSRNLLDQDGISYSSSVSAEYGENLALIGLMSLGKSATGSATSIVGPLSIAKAFGGLMPQEWTIAIGNRSGSSLDTSAAAHAVIYQGVKIA